MTWVPSGILKSADEKLKPSMSKNGGCGKTFFLICVENNLIKYLNDNSAILDIKFRQEPRFCFNQWRFNQKYKSVVGEHGKMVSMTQKGRKSMYN